MISGHKKVHIIPVAFDEDRAVLPVKEIGADKAYILTGAQEGEMPLCSAIGQNVKNKLKRSVKEVEVVNYGFYNYDNIFSHLVKIAKKESKNNVFINLSSGGRIVAIAGTLAASMYGWTPYYTIPKKYAKDGKSSGLKDVFEITTYPIEKPDDDLVICLSLMEGIETQKSLMLKLEKKGIFLDDEPGEKLSKRSYMEFKRRYMDPLVEKGWITKDTRGRSSRLEKTKEGKEIVKIFDTKS